MKKRTKRMGFFVVLVVVAIAMFACDGGGDNGNGGNGGDNGNGSNTIEDKWMDVADSTFSHDTINSIVWGNDKFVATANGGIIVYSTDGITWSFALSYAIFLDVGHIAWGNNMFVAAGRDKSGISVMAYSFDGIIWTLTETNIYSPRIVWANDKFVAVGTRGKMAYSTDGITWTAVDDILDDILVDYNKYDEWYLNINSIAWGNNKFIMSCRYSSLVDYDYYDVDLILYSENGIKWQEIEGSNIYDIIPNVSGITWGNDKFVAVGNEYKISENELLVFYRKSAYSTDGIKWTAIENTTFVDTQITCIAWGNNKFVAGGTRGKMAYWNGNVK